VNVITIEDPVEYRLAGIYQLQVNTKIDFTFAKALRTVPVVLDIARDTARLGAAHRRSRARFGGGRSRV